MTTMCDFVDNPSFVWDISSWAQFDTNGCHNDSINFNIRYKYTLILYIYVCVFWVRKDKQPIDILIATIPLLSLRTALCLTGGEWYREASLMKQSLCKPNALELALMAEAQPNLFKMSSLSLTNSLTLGVEGKPQLHYDTHPRNQRRATLPTGTPGAILYVWSHPLFALNQNPRQIICDVRESG